MSVKAEMVEAMLRSRSGGDEGCDATLADLLDFSGENARRLVVEAALDAALLVAARRHVVFRLRDGRLTPVGELPDISGQDAVSASV